MSEGDHYHKSDYFEIEFAFDNNDNDDNVDLNKNNANLFNDTSNCDGSINNRRILFEADWLKKVIN